MATFLSNLNPKWTKQGMLKMFDAHPSEMTQESETHLKEHLDGDVAAFEKIVDCAREKGEAFSEERPTPPPGHRMIIHRFLSFIK